LNLPQALFLAPLEFSGDHQSFEVFALITIPPIEIVCAELAARLDQILMGN
jgi:hypothetical protein